MGSRKGILNKNKKFLLSRLQDMYGEEFDPIMRMAEIAINATDEHLQLSAWKEVSQYVYPKLKSVEVTGDEDNPVVTAMKIELVKPEQWS